MGTNAKMKTYKIMNVVVLEDNNKYTFELFGHKYSNESASKNDALDIARKSIEKAIVDYLLLNKHKEGKYLLASPVFYKELYGTPNLIISPFLSIISGHPNDIQFRTDDEWAEQLKKTGLNI